MLLKCFLIALLLVQVMESFSPSRNGNISLICTLYIAIENWLIHVTDLFTDLMDKTYKESSNSDIGPADVIQDLHAKYQMAVNKAENVAANALQSADKALNQQENDVNIDSVNSNVYLGEPSSLFRFRRRAEAEEDEEVEEDDENEEEDEDEAEESSLEADRVLQAQESSSLEAEKVVEGDTSEAAKIPPEKIDKMIDLMNSLNQQFGN